MTEDSKSLDYSDAVEYLFEAVSMPDIEGTALRAARAAGRIHLKRLRRISIELKASNPIDLVTEADREAEGAISAILRRRFPTHSILAEEGSAETRPAPHRWIVDPLDGTTNFAHSYPQFSVSIAYEQHGRVLFAVVYDALKKEMFSAARGKGARLNGKPIRVSRTAAISSSLLGTGFPYDRRLRPRFYLTFWEAFLLRCQGIRRTGSAALDLANVACGRIDGFWEFGLKPWDVAAGALLVREAGGRVTNMDGSPLDLAGGKIVASNGRFHRQMLGTIAMARPEAERRQREADETGNPLAPPTAGIQSSPRAAEAPATQGRGQARDR